MWALIWSGRESFSPPLSVTHSAHIFCNTLSHFPKICRCAPRPHMSPLDTWMPDSQRRSRRCSCNGSLRSDSFSGPFSWEIADHRDMCEWNSAVDKQLQQRQKNKGRCRAAITAVKRKGNQARVLNKCIRPGKTFKSGFSPFRVKDCENI